MMDDMVRLVMMDDDKDEIANVGSDKKKKEWKYKGLRMT